MRKSLLIMIAAGIVGWLLAMTIHVWAQQPSPEQLKTFSIEFHIRAFVSKDRHPVTFSDYTGETFKTAKDCLARLAKPDTKLAATSKGFTEVIHEHIGKDAQIDWTCVVFLSPPTGRDV